MPEGMSWEAIPEALLTDCAQLVKANSIEGTSSASASAAPSATEASRPLGNKKDNITIIWTPADNLKVRSSVLVGN